MRRSWRATRITARMKYIAIITRSAAPIGGRGGNARGMRLHPSRSLYRGQRLVVRRGGALTGYDQDHP